MKKILQEIGLTEGETKVYLALLGLGDSTVSPISRKSRVSISKIYSVLERLGEKGLVSSTSKNNVKHFIASGPERINEFFEERKKKIETEQIKFKERIAELKSKQLEVDKGVSVEIYEGFKAVTTAYEECLDEMKKGDESLFFSIGEEDFSDKNIQTFFMNLALKRKEKKISMRGVAPNETKTIFNKYPIKMNMRYTNFKLPTGMSVYQSKIILISWIEKPSAIVIQSESLVKSYKEFFESMWAIAKR